MADKVFLDESGITVTEEQLLVPGRSFKIIDIDSVGVTGKRPSRLAQILVGLVGLAIWVPQSDTWWVGYAGLGIVALAWIWVRRLKTRYSIVLSTGDDGTTALESQDELLIERIVKALNDAMHVPN